MLKNCQPSSLQSDHDGSDYLADDEMSACSSPSHSKLSDTEHEDHSQDTITYRGLKKVNEENHPVENDDLSLFPLHLVGNQLEVIPSIKAENGANEHKQLDSGEVESHSSEDDMNENEYECASFKTDQHGLNQIESEIIASTHIEAMQYQLWKSEARLDVMEARKEMIPSLKRCREIRGMFVTKRSIFFASDT
ncbi:uncharacterized protein LOC110062989 isoform X2 [Orbicella faveolata]|uniref:uncharacterized protein LOC110062989 isoform X2 n=1 Tax=Orbicella faveolata TaxID=48498 RepID=UPI0009E4C1EE|nr:uncharacterized protein LOC110062989 isoform X2 [Orbicella faveolata]